MGITNDMYTVVGLLGVALSTSCGGLPPYLASIEGVPAWLSTRYQSMAERQSGAVNLEHDLNGLLRLPVITQEGEIDSLWLAASSGPTAPVMLTGSVPGLRVSGELAKVKVLTIKASDQGSLSTKVFRLTRDMKSLALEMIGDGDMSNTYVSLSVSIDGLPMIEWARQAPSSVSKFETFRVDVSRIFERSQAKNVTAIVSLHNRGTAKFLCVKQHDQSGASTLSLLDKIADPMLAPSPYAQMNRLINSNVSQQQQQLLEYILQRAGDSFNIRKYASDFGVTNETLRKMCLAVSREILDDKYTLEGVSDPVVIERAIRDGIKPCFELLGVEDNSLLRDRLLLHAYGTWVRTRILYDQTYFTHWDESRKIQGDQSKYVLAWSPRRAVCGGIQVSFRDIAKAGGYKVTMITCHTRGRNSTPSDHANHTVAVVRLDNGLCLPFDGSSSTISLSDARRMEGAIHSHWALPITANEMGVFLAYRHQQNENNYSFGDPQNTTLFLKVSLSEWKKWDVRVLDKFEPKPLLDSGFFYGN